MQHVADVVAGRRPSTLPLASSASVGERRGVHRVLDVRVAARSVPSAPLRAIGSVEALGRAAVVLADDDVLRDVHQTTGQVARVGGPERGVGQTLAGTVRRDEVLGHRQTLAVRWR